MATAQKEVLSPADIEHFITCGFIKLKSGLDPALMKRWVDRTWARTGYDPADRSTWKRERIHLPFSERISVRERAPRAYAAICQLVGGDDRLNGECEWSDGLIVNYSNGVGKEWIPPSPAAGGWHKDGDFFMHFLDSPEQGLLSILLLDDVVHRGGPTYMACDSVVHVARFLAEHPEGVHPDHPADRSITRFDNSAIVSRCRDFREATGVAGDIYLMHPFMLHSVSYNHCGRARFIANPCVSLKEPMIFDRLRAERHSPVERASLRALGVDSYRIAATAPRQAGIPGRDARNDEFEAEEKARLAALKPAT
jgi:hypothetical protein